MNFNLLAQAAGNLQSADKSKADRAFGALASAFVDVVVPSEMMELSEDEKRTVLSQAAEELQAEFDAAAVCPPSSQGEMDDFAQRVDGLWLMVVAALPEKAASLAAALDNLAENFVLSLSAGGVSPEEMLSVLRDETNPFHRETVGMMLARGVQPRLVIRKLSS